MVSTVYTIGYSSFTSDEFWKTLVKNHVQLVIDVRSTPFSKRYPEYNKDVLKEFLAQHRIFYRNYAREFGARQEDHKFYTRDGYLDFELFSQSEAFRSGVEKLCKSMEQDYIFALMCAEKNPIDCHRAIMVSRAFSDKGYRVLHILPHGKILTQDDFNQELLDKYYPSRFQLSLIDSSKSDADLLKQAYRYRNADIGYRMEDV